MILLDQVSKYYPTRDGKRQILNKVTAVFEPGCSYGVLGVNGAGKSTLISLIAGKSAPDSGNITKVGRVSWPFGYAGAHPNMTGRDNCKFVARAYGEDPEWVAEFVEDFAELGPYFDEPYGSYSSGMASRLGFGLSMAIPFDWYLVDEGLGAGDARFTKKSERLIDLKRANSDFIIVSHQTSFISHFCSRAAVLHNEVLTMYSDTRDAIRFYQTANR
jgi:capsular polysaccharide transport system ATP-binding protein